MGRPNLLLMIFGVILAVLPLASTWNMYMELFLGLIWVGLIIYLQLHIGKQVLGAVIIFVLLLQGQWGLAQFISQDDLGFYMLGETRLGAEKIGVAKFSYGESKLIRAYGPYPHANSFGGVMSMGILIMFIWLMGKKYDSSSYYRLITVGIFVFTAAVIVSFSRVAYTVIGFTIIVYFLNLYKLGVLEKKILFRLVILMAVLGAVLTPMIIARVSDGEDVAAAERLMGAKWAMEIISGNSIWRGVGVGNYKRALTNYLEAQRVEHEYWQIDYVHSVPLLVVAELGVVISLLLAVAVIGLIAIFYRHSWWGFVPVLPMILFDHYVATQIAPLVLLLAIVVLLQGKPLRVVH